MKLRKEVTWWRMLTEPNTIPMPEFIRRFFRTPLGRSITRGYRKLPRLSIYFALCALLLAIATVGGAPYLKLTYETWNSMLEGLRYGPSSMLPADMLLFVGVFASLLVVRLYMKYAKDGLGLSRARMYSWRKATKRTQRRIYALLIVSLLAIKILPLTLDFADAERLKQQQAFNAGFKMWKLDTATVSRIVSEEHSDHWEVDPDDSDTVREIKIAWVQTGSSGRATLEKLARERLAQVAKRTKTAGT